MELGNLLGKLKGQDTVAPKKFLALVLTDEVVQSAVWHVVDGNTEILAIGTPVEWDGDTGTTSELITAVDATISSATEGLEEEPDSVILGVPQSWTDKDGILGVKKTFINQIRKELELTALGYVAITDSILSYLKIQEGTPTTSILIQVSRDELTILLVRLGRIEAIETIGRSDDIVDDVSEGIARFKLVDNLPSRIILFNSMHNLDELIQNLLSVDWQAQFNFLHTPKIESLAKDVTIRALSVAGGAEIAKSLGLEVLPPSPLPSDSEPIDETLAEPIPEPMPEPDTTLVSPESIGFTVGLAPLPSNVVSPPSPKIDFIDQDDEPTIPVAEVAPPVTKARVFKAPKFTMPHFKLTLPTTKPLFWYLGGGLLVLALLILYLVWFMPKAVITVYVTPKTLEQDVQLTLSTTATSIDFAESVVPAVIDKVTQSGEKIIETTGKKTIGDPAKGSVTIFNRTSTNKTFAKGTQLSVGSLQFTLDDNVSVASKSAGSDYVDVPGKASADITARSIGEASNISAGTEFTLQSFGKDSYVAKNDVALGGGTEETVQVVGKDDQKNLTESLTSEILATLVDQASSQSEPGVGLYLIPDSAKVDSETFSLKAGEVGTNLSLNLTLSATLLRYQTDNVTTLVNSAIDAAVPAGFVRANLPSTVDLTANNVDEDAGLVKGLAKVKVSLLPVIAKSDLLASVKGSSPSALENILKQYIAGYQSAEVSITPRLLPPRFKVIPLNPTSIEIKITPAL